MLILDFRFRILVVNEFVNDNRNQTAQSDADDFGIRKVFQIIRPPIVPSLCRLELLPDEAIYRRICSRVHIRR